MIVRRIDMLLRYICNAALQRMLGYLESNYRPDGALNAETTLSIAAGRNGARLTHGHATQYAYVRQSLLLWRTILRDFYAMWQKAEDDFLDADRPARLCDTGQGLNRVQASPRVARASEFKLKSNNFIMISQYSRCFLR